MKTTNPGKQRKLLFKAPLTDRYRRFSSPLSSELKKSHNANCVAVRRGDTVKVMRGDRKGFEGKVRSVDRKKYRVFIEGASREKVDGTLAFASFHPSKVLITRLNLDDKWRRRALERKRSNKKTELSEEKKQISGKKAAPKGKEEQAEEKTPEPLPQVESVETKGE